MSSSFEIFLHERPSREAILGALPSKALQVDWGKEDRSDISFQASRRRWGKTEVCFRVEGPFPVEPGEAVEPVEDYIMGPRWRISVGLPSPPRRRWRGPARKWALRLAKAAKGAVLDQESGAMIQPRKKVKPPEVSTVDQNLSLVVFQWNFLEKKHGEGKSDLFHRVFEKSMVRYTPFFLQDGPLAPKRWLSQSRNLDEFRGGWAKGLEEERPARFLFRVDSPFYTPELFFGSVNEGSLPGVDAGGLRRIRAELKLNGRSLRGEPVWREFVVSSFLRISKELEAFYSIAYVEGGYALDIFGIDGIHCVEGVLYCSPETEDYPIVKNPDWGGLPPTPGWLVWFGRPYRERVKPDLGKLDGWLRSRPGTAFEESGEGLFLRMGEDPTGLDDLEGVPYTLPEGLVDKSPPPHFHRDYLSLWDEMRKKGAG